MSWLADLRTWKITQWLQPFVGFILPAVIFSLNVPRRRKIQPPALVFPKDIGKYKYLIKALLCALSAALVVTFDTIGWLCYVLALAGPLLVSGLYEAWIDKRVVDYMSRKNNFDKLDFALRSKILIAVLVGNLDLDVAWMSAMNIAGPLERREISDAPTQAQLEARERETSAAIRNIQKRISSMLACQYSFGSTIGAPVIFYIGSFIYALLEIRAQLGDKDTAAALAFGLWWMTIPHIAIVNGCLLAGNNPNTLEAIVPYPTGPSIRITNPPASPPGTNSAANGEGTVTISSLDGQEQGISGAQKRGQLTSRLPYYGPTYDAQYQPQWMIDRGKSKREWLFCLIEVHQRRRLGLHDGAHGQLEDLRTRLDMGPGDWLALTVSALLLIIIPCMFGFLVAYLTPQIGVSCRSFTVLMYATSQVGLLLLWLWDITWRDEKWRKRRSPKGGRLYSDMMSPGVTTQPLSRRAAVQNQTTSIAPTANVAARPFHTDQHNIRPGAHARSLSGNNGDEMPMVTVPSQGDSSMDSSDAEAGPAAILVSHGLFSRTMSFLAKAKWTRPNYRGAALSRAGAVLYWALMTFLLLLAVFSAIGGTVMQILGVYRTCLCEINVGSWLSGRDSASMIISNNTSQDIRLAHDTWIPIGSVAAAFLGITAYIAWWYQRRLRFRFALLLRDDYLGVLNNEMRPPSTRRQVTEDSLVVNDDGSSPSTVQPAILINGRHQPTAHGGVTGIAEVQPGTAY